GMAATGESGGVDANGGRARGRGTASRSGGPMFRDCDVDPGAPGQGAAFFWTELISLGLSNIFPLPGAGMSGKGSSSPIALNSVEMTALLLLTPIDWSDGKTPIGGYPIFFRFIKLPAARARSTSRTTSCREPEKTCWGAKVVLSEFGETPRP